MRAPPLPRADRSAGFTLIEVLVAFAIATLLLGALYQVFSTGLRSSARAEHYANAVLLAESGLDALAGTPVALGETNDRFGIYVRQTDIRARPDLGPPDDATAIMPYEIQVRVAWREGVSERSVQLSTLRTGPREPTRP
ncbi:MAG TPA: prepilin-type N-terminal cleavage/methylation domain-containing protein [Stellaceae bacterium]|nr:prepilin-type N-terminal cleavage/methylation domain-containing protein [Stellaceae bacterium]